MFDPDGTLDIESLSMLLKVKFFMFSNVFPIQLTGTKITNASKVMGMKIFMLQYNKF